MAITKSSMVIARAIHQLLEQWAIHQLLEQCGYCFCIFLRCDDLVIEVRRRKMRKIPGPYGGNLNVWRRWISCVISASRMRTWQWGFISHVYEYGILDSFKIAFTPYLFIYHQQTLCEHDRLYPQGKMNGAHHCFVFLCFNCWSERAEFENYLIYFACPAPTQDGSFSCSLLVVKFPLVIFEMHVFRSGQPS